MKVWIDLTNSPHVNFFADMIRELQQDHEVLLTCRPLANTIDLLEINEFSYHVVGRHYGQNVSRKAWGFIVRILQLYSFLRNKDIDVAISHSSFYSPLVANLLGARSIYLNDNEHAAGNRISFLFSDRIMVPEFLDLKKVRRQWAQEKRIIRYPGVKEGIYLWRDQLKLSVDCKRVDRGNRKTIFIRSEPWTAQYYRGKTNFIDDLLIDLKDTHKVVLLPRIKEQAEYYRQEKFAGITVPDKSFTLMEIMENCDLFIGAGGTMTREASVLGIPTISIYQDNLLDVDRFLIKQGLLIHKIDLNSRFVIDFLNRTKKSNPNRQLLDKGKEAYRLILRTILNN